MCLLSAGISHMQRFIKAGSDVEGDNQYFILRKKTTQVVLVFIDTNDDYDIIPNNIVTY